jgi:hypothetical protein
VNLQHRDHTPKDLRSPIVRRPLRRLALRLSNWNDAGLPLRAGATRRDAFGRVHAPSSKTGPLRATRFFTVLDASTSRVRRSRPSSPDVDGETWDVVAHELDH